MAVIGSDWHSAPRAWSRRPDITGDAYHGISQLFQLAISLRVPVIGPGDLFDSREPDSRSVWLMVQEIRRLSQHGLQLIFVEGNHEISSPPWVSLAGDGLIHLDPDHPLTLPNGSRLIGLDYCQPDRVRRSLECLPPGDILITHQVFREFTPRGAASLAWVPHCYRLIISGDCHKCIRLDLPGGRVAISPGPLCMQAIDEDPNKYIYVLCEDLSVHPIKLQTRPFLRAVVDTEAAFELLLASQNYQLFPNAEGLPEVIARPFIVVEYDNTIRDAYSRLQNRFGADCFLEAVPTTPEAAAILQSRPTVHNDSISSALVACGCPAAHEDHQLSIDLWSCQDIDGALNSRFPPLN